MTSPGGGLCSQRRGKTLAGLILQKPGGEPGSDSEAITPAPACLPQGVGTNNLWASNARVNASPVSGISLRTPKPESADLCNWILHYVYKNEMKTILIITAIIICGLLEGNSHNATKSKNSKIVVRPTPSTLDSIQGAWTDIFDLSNNITINGRNVDEYYNSTEVNVHEYYRVYFSDTLVADDNLLSEVNIDTSATSGEYLIEVENSSGGIFCYHINGFTTEPNTNLLDWALQATFGHRAVTVYRQH